MLKIIYVILATAMFFFNSTYFSIGSSKFSLKNPSAVAIIFLALLVLIVTARLERFIVLMRHTIIQILPYIVPLLFSFFIWLSSGANTYTIWNGTIMLGSQLLAVGVSFATLCLFGSKGIWYCLGSMCLANFFEVLSVIREGGLTTFLNEFIALLVSFSAETGPLIRKLELHDLTFAFGPFLIYLIMERNKKFYSLWWALPVSFFFLTGLKRIAVLAVIIALFLGLILQYLPDKASRQTALCFAVGMIFISFLYIVGIRYGLFEYLENVYHLDTKGRMERYKILEQYYDINIAFMGQGIGFERVINWMAGEKNQYRQTVAHLIHNDFLRMYISIGFVGYWSWLWSYLPVRLRYWFKYGGKHGGCLFLAICIYCFTLYATDNTIYYFYTAIACSIIPMSCGLETLENNIIKK